MSNLEPQTSDIFYYRACPQNFFVHNWMPMRLKSRGCGALTHKIAVLAKKNALFVGDVRRQPRTAASRLCNLLDSGVVQIAYTALFQSLQLAIIFFSLFLDCRIFSFCGRSVRIGTGTPRVHFRCINRATWQVFSVCFEREREVG